MQSDWAAEQLSLFVDKINDLFELDADAHLVVRPTEIEHQADGLDDELTMLEPVMRMVMNAARPGLGEYERAEGDDYHHRFRWSLAKRQALQARGIHVLGADAKARLRPDAPELIADEFHEWVWEAARPQWEQSGKRQEGIDAAARVVNARLQQKLSRRDIGEAALCREAFTTDDPSRADRGFASRAIARRTLGRAAKTGAASSAPDASQVSATPWRTNTTSTCPSPWRWSSWPLSACSRAGSRNAMWRSHEHERFRADGVRPAALRRSLRGGLPDDS